MASHIDALKKSSKNAKDEISKLHDFIEDLQSGSGKKDESLLFNEKLNGSLYDFGNDQSMIDAKPQTQTSILNGSMKNQPAFQLFNQKDSIEVETDVQKLCHSDQFGTVGFS